MSCPDLAQLERFVRRELDEAASNSTKDHLSSCANCTEQVATLRENLAFGEEIKAVADMTRTRDPAVPGAPVEGRGGRTPALPHDSFPGYKLVREIHRGGQGVVYQAIQKSTKRKVAIKVLKEGPFAGIGEKARFEREIQILGQLKHPHIVTIYDSGTAAGQHYFVMDYISGHPLDVYMAGREHSIEETLDLFAKICDAINAAHLRGVIHRDLKPGNIRIDEAGEPHVLDFGLAKVTGGDQGVSMMTMTGQFIGSLPWASPEQAEAAPSKIDVRTDVYSLGVLLYQMLTGKFPYDVAGNMRDVLDNILKAEPTKPSTLRKHINDEVETIVLKCLSKERERRYQSAGELGRDVQRYLAGEPIEAKRESFGYLLRKQLRRYRVPAAIAASFVVVLIGFSVSMTVMYRQAAEAELLATEAELLATEAKRLADSRRIEAEGARTAAEKARDAESRQRDAFMWQAYVGSIAAADSAYQASEFHRMRSQLTAAPARHRNWEWQYLDRLAHPSALTIAGHDHMVSAVAYSPDGLTIASSSRDHTIRIWNALTGAPIETLRGHDNSVSAIAFSPDGRRIASGSFDRTVCVWNIDSGQVEARFVGHADEVHSVAFHPRGRQVVSTSADGIVRVWDTKTAKALAVLEAHEGLACRAAFSPDGSLLATAGHDGAIKFWSTDSYAPVAEIVDTSRKVRAVTFSPDGRLLALGSHDEHIEIWDVERRSRLRQMPAEGRSVWSVAFSPDGRHLASGCSDHTIRIWSVDSGERLAVLRGHSELVRSLAFSPDGTRLASGSWDWTVRLWDATTFGYEANLLGHEDQVLAVAISPDGQRVVSGSLDHTVRLWNIHTGRCLAVLRGHESRIRSVAYSPDAGTVASGSMDGTVRVWDTATGAQASRFDHGSGVYSVAYSPDGRRLAYALENGSIYIRDIKSGRINLTLTGHESRIWSIAYSPDGRTLASGGGDKTVRLWNTQNGNARAVLPGHGHDVYAVAFSPDGRYLASGARDQTIGIWDAATGQQIDMLRGHGQFVTALTFSPDSTRLVTASWFKTIKLWDMGTREEVATLRGHTSAIRSVAFSPDGHRIVSASHDGTIRIWDDVGTVTRSRQRKKALDLAQEAAPLVEHLLATTNSPSEVAEAIRSNRSLGQAERDAALDVLLERSTR